MTARLVDTLLPSGISAPKYQTSNPIARQLVEGFLQSALALARRSGARRVHEIGCGEGQLSGMLAAHGFDVRGCDLDEESLAVARAGADKAGLKIPFARKSIYELKPDDAEELVMCCEVLEHLEHPDAALEQLVEIANPWLIVSVPREPIWRGLNMARAKYLGGLGNTPGHINHWSSSGFRVFVAKRIEPVEMRKPLPWTVLLCRKF